MVMDTVSIIVNPQPVVNHGDGEMACEGETVVLDAGPGFNSYFWSNASVDQSISVEDEGTYSVTVTNDLGCQASDTTTVVINPLPVFSLPQDTMICAEDITVFDPGMNNDFIIDGVLQETYVVEGFAPGSYTVMAIVVNEFDCEEEAELNFTVDICVGTEAIANQESISLFPNPSSGLTWLQLENLRPATYGVHILNAAGQLVQENRILPMAADYQVEIDLTAMPAGIYLVRLVSDGTLVTRRLIIE